MISALLHVGLVVLCVGLATTRSVPLPQGVEVMYGEGGVQRTAVLEKSRALPKAQAFVDSSDAPALESKKETPVAPAPAVEQKALGSQQGASDQGALSGREGVINGTEVSPEERYLYEIRKLLERRQRYPMMAKKMGQTGKVTVRFTLAQDGSLQDSEIIERTPYDSLNKAAQELVQGLDKLKPFPQEIQRTSWVITVPIEYSLN